MTLATSWTVQDPNLIVAKNVPPARFFDPHSMHVKRLPRMGAAQSRTAIIKRHHPEWDGVFYGGQYRTRTCDPMHVKHVLIPAELTVHQQVYYFRFRHICQALFLRIACVFAGLQYEAQESKI